jgi:predicted nucleotidyltransferase component of viral defense system
VLKSKKDLIGMAKELDYKPEILEKVYRLLTALQRIMSVPYLKERLVLKGGTALNLFSFDEVPRLSIDIDFNYVGQVNRAKMLEEKRVLNEAIIQIFRQNQFELCRNPTHHAGGKMIWHYSSLLGQGGNIEIDLNYMYRQPLWPCLYKQAKINFGESFIAPILDIHELAAGKLSALFTRQASRDLFDTYYMFKHSDLDMAKLRLAFVVYIAMTTMQASQLDIGKLQYNLLDIRSKLLPVLRQQELPRKTEELK